MENREEQEKVPGSIREYLSSFRQTRSVIAWIWKHIVDATMKRRVILFMVIAVLITISSIILPGIIGNLFDALDTKNSEGVYWSLISFCAWALILKGKDLLNAAINEWNASQFNSHLNITITKLFFEKTIGQHKAYASQLSVSNIEKGRGRAMELWSLIIYKAPSVVIKVTISIGALCYYGVPGLIMVSVALVYVWTSLYLNLRVIRDVTSIDADMRKLNRYLAGRFEGVERVKVFGRMNEELAIIEMGYIDVNARDRDFWLWYINFSKWRSLYSVFALTGVLAHSAYQIWNGNMSPGMLFPMYMWAQMAQDCFWQVASIEREIQWNMPSVRSMIEVLTMKPWFREEDRTGVVDWSNPPTISFCDVSHTYEVSDTSSSGKQVLQNISFEIKAGTTCALVGRSGGGKSTLASLALQFSDPTSGSILLNGSDLRTISPASLYTGIGYVSQQAIVFDGTLRENLTYGLSREEREHTSDERLYEIMDLLKITFGPRESHGLDMVVGKNGMKLSGGQRQRVAIGAALVKNPQFVVIDEGTSSLDSETERSVQEGIDRLLHSGVTVLVIAHRFSTIRQCDQIVVLRPIGEVAEGESQIEATGSFDEVLVTSPTFRASAESQGMSMPATAVAG